MKPFVWGVVVGVAVLLAIPLLVLGTGMFNVSAAGGPGAVEKALASWAVGASIYWRAPDKQIPMEVDDESLCFRTGAVPFDVPAISRRTRSRAGRVRGGPLSARSQPDGNGRGRVVLDDHQRHPRDRTPAFGSTHSDEEIWHLVAFVQHLPDLTQAEKQALRQRQSDGHGHGGAGHHDDREEPESTDHQGTEDDSHQSHAHDHG